MNTYPEMNEKIVELLRISDEPACLYAAMRIEELEKENMLLKHASQILADKYKDSVDLMESQGITFSKIERRTP
jgi:predicted Zn-ribbon and HTH transcriptional regulator